MAKGKAKHPIQKALETCHSTMSAWNRKKIAKRAKGSRTACAGFAKTRVRFAPEGGWSGGAPEQNGYRTGGAK